MCRSNLFLRERFKTLIGLALLGASLLTTGPAMARTLSFATASPPTKTGINRALTWWANQVAQRTDGDLKVNIHYMGSLVKLKDAVDGISAGVADAGEVIPAYSQSRMPLHYLSTTGVGSGNQYVAMEAWSRMYKKFPQLQAELDRNNMVYLCHYSIGASVLISKGKPYLSPKDFDGDKIRFDSRWTRAAKMAGWNVTPVNLTFPDIYTALQRGTIDGAQSYLNMVIPYRHNEVSDYVVEPHLGQQTNIVVMNKRVFDSLPKKDRKVIVDLRREWMIRDARGDLADNKTARANLENDPRYPTKVVELSDAQRKAWEPGVAKADQEIVARMAKRAPVAPKLYAAYQAEIKKVAREVKENGYPWEQKNAQ